ncbi:hypothetical protein HK105_200535 [Polyrhizophydium stewartii]|uniref:Alcohol dehydrogenase-like C-terminal domain-containing protein n=1 Tax=Polyrhizophydium stewartii TaxID=2732419 RepID=A0ABR4NJA8_9FUNG
MLLRLDAGVAGGGGGGESGTSWQRGESGSGEHWSLGKPKWRLARHDKHAKERTALTVESNRLDGTDEKVALLKSQFGFDEAFNYKTVPSISEALGAAAPKGIDVYFDNVGGEHLDAALAHINVHGRIAACGMISGYNGQQYTFKNLTNIIGRQVKIEGFIIGGKLADPEFTARFGGEVGKWVLEGKLKYAEHVVEGIAKAPDAFVGLFKGDNTGKLIIKV